MVDNTVQNIILAIISLQLSVLILSTNIQSSDFVDITVLVLGYVPLVIMSGYITVKLLE